MKHKPGEGNQSEWREVARETSAPGIFAIKYDEKLCKGCRTEPAMELHTCPYRVNILHDNISVCACCVSCMIGCGNESEIL